MKNTMSSTKYTFLFYVVLSCCIYAVLHNTVGLYYHEWEIMANSFFLFEYNMPVDFSFSSPVWPIIAPTISMVSYQVNFSLFPILYYLLVILNTSLFFFSLRIVLSDSSRKDQLIAHCIAFFVLLPIIFYVSNKSLVIWLCFNLSLLYYIAQETKTQKLTYFSYGLLALAILIRFDMTLIYGVYALAFSILFKQKFWRFSLAIFLASFAVSLLFEWVSFNFYHEFYHLERAERILLDKGLLGQARLNEDYTIIALSQYIYDNSVLGNELYKSLVADFKLWTYLQSPLAIFATIENLTEFVRDISNYGIYLFSLILWSFILISRNFQVKLLLFYLIILGTPIALAPFFKIPGVFWISVVTCTFLGLLLSNTSFLLQKKWPLVISLGLIVSWFVYDNIRTVSHKSHRYEAYRDLMETLDAEEKTIVFSHWAPNFENLNPRISLQNIHSRIAHYYMDYFFFSRYDFIKKKNEAFFENKYEYLVEKLKICEEREVAFFIDDEYRVFLDSYLKKYHGITLNYKEFSFVSYETLRDEDIHAFPYKISISSH